MARPATEEEKQVFQEMEAALANDPIIPEPELTDGPAPLPPVDDAPEPEKRKPGRPKGSGAKQTEDALFNEVPGNEGKAKPGRKPGAKATDKKPIDKLSLANNIMGIHQLAAVMTGINEFQLHEKEAQGLADGVIAVCDEYGFSIGGKTGAAIQLFAAAAMVYAPRVLQFKYRMAQEQAARDQANNQAGTFHVFDATANSAR